MVFVALLLAVFLFERIRGWQFYRTTLFLPYLLPITVVGLIFSYIFQLSGVLNEFLKLIGLGGLALDWLGSTRWALPTLMFVIIWKEVGFGIVLFLARLMSVEEELFDAAKSTGRTGGSLQWHITVPQLASRDRVLHRRFGDHHAFVGVQLRVRDDRRRAGKSTMVTELYVT